MEEQLAPAVFSKEAELPMTRLLSGIAHTLESGEDAEVRIRYVLNQLQHLVPYDRCALLSVGVSGEETLTMVPEEGHDPDHLQPALKRLWNLLQHEEVTLREAASWGRATGSEDWQSRLAVPLVGLNEVVGVLAVGRSSPDAYRELDLQRLAIVASQIASYLAALQARRHELEQERLARDYAVAEQARLEAFMAMLGHELRNPLAILHNAMEVLRVSQSDQATWRQSFGAMDRQVGALTQITDDLLDLARIKGGKLRLQQTDIELNAFVQRIAASAQSLFAHRDQDLTVSVADAALWVHGDPLRLEQVLSNLLANSAKCTPEYGPVWLTIAADGDHAVIQVRDSGAGIAPDMLPHIFDLYNQGPKESDQAQGGLGIRLAVVKTLVDMHGGTITATSPGMGKGSEFTIHLPTVPSPTPQPAQPPADLSGSSGRSLRVLLVDDSADATRMFGIMLKACGYEVRTAHDGPCALETAAEFRPDVVLLDIGLPGMDGYEVARRIRDTLAFQDVVLVALTGYGMEEDRVRSGEAGFDHHLLKPVDFTTTVRDLLETVAKTKASG